MKKNLLSDGCFESVAAIGQTPLSGTYDDSIPIDTDEASKWFLVGPLSLDTPAGGNPVSLNSLMSAVPEALSGLSRALTVTGGTPPLTSASGSIALQQRTEGYKASRCRGRTVQLSFWVYVPKPKNITVSLSLDGDASLVQEVVVLRSSGWFQVAREVTVPSSTAEARDFLLRVELFDTSKSADRLAAGQVLQVTGFRLDAPLDVTDVYAD